jgi:hypothetical protein
LPVVTPRWPQLSKLLETIFSHSQQPAVRRYRRRVELDDRYIHPGDNLDLSFALDDLSIHQYRLASSLTWLVPSSVRGRPQRALTVGGVEQIAAVLRSRT